MKKKDIIVITICILIIGGSLFLILKGFMPKPQKKNIQKETIDFTGEIDENAIKKLKERKDYGSPTMDNIGRDNPFASL